MPDPELHDDEFITINDAEKMCVVKKDTMRSYAAKHIFGDMILVDNEETGRKTYAIRVGELRKVVAELIENGGRVRQCTEVINRRGNPDGDEDLWPVVLAKHIIHQACIDLAVGYARRDPRMIYDCESFFRSRWYGKISFGTEGELMIELVRRKCGVDP